MHEQIKTYGEIEILSRHRDGRNERRLVRNRVLLGGRVILAKTLGNALSGGPFLYYVQSMSWGSGGTVGGQPRYVDDTLTGLFGPVVLTKAVIATINPGIPNQVTFTSVISFADANGATIDEAALILASGDTFSMTTFGGISISPNFELVFNWRESFI